MGKNNKKALDDMLKEVPATMNISEYAFVMSHDTKEHHDIVGTKYKGVNIVSVNNRLCEFDKIYLTPNPMMDSSKFTETWERINT
jgi:hypothetical protein